MQNSIPRHVGIIMDGNGRWARRRLMPRALGHSAGMNRMIEIATRAKEAGVEYLTVYALSTENLKNRPEDELEGLFDLIRKYFTENLKKLLSEGAAVKVIGDLSPLPEDVRKIMREGEEQSPEGAPFTLIFAVNYGGRDEIARAAQAAAKAGEVSPETISENLYTADIPDPDLIIRTGGEVRLSNFLMWQSAYTELYFTSVLFPDFGKKEFDKAIKAYSKRERRFGGI